ncbi:uncharacterized protein MONOS_3334 [Monocercomonoides exilis]|uniref:uncharacterized protein n=1 Tax=Monocercomonoides exilis TaxID=2049356 RepID=UPI0035593FF0|nr:hypothetical protein MONOS_3334 [Monocercomonoides exilis]|eukprot:MONOS_3334.1-p1 / transcript=MONOS_3334.1 / gene=MONOS_3334 / organism=Monocercomonoides_exilis_PA203 / gene_product=unspecified product / transcript_product=unspecified product / location=Mono_scaffold00077:116900-117187(+) / protein_length=96 / sequence_SO=supercontig / SO=protein_coding / is_pseudo=false
MAWPDTRGKGVVVKVGSGVSVVGGANGSGGGGGRRGGTRSFISERSEKNIAGANRGGGGGEEGADATVWQKMNTMEKETKMLKELQKVKEHAIRE